MKPSPKSREILSMSKNNSRNWNRRSEMFGLQWMMLPVLSSCGPVFRLKRSAKTSALKCAALKPNWKARIIGQDQAIDAVVAAIRRSKVHLSAKRRPASFIFVGPTGVGKTELSKVLAEGLFDNKVDPLIRVDMSEYMEKQYRLPSDWFASRLCRIR